MLSTLTSSHLRLLLVLFTFASAGCTQSAIDLLGDSPPNDDAAPRDVGPNGDVGSGQDMGPDGNVLTDAGHDALVSGDATDEPDLGDPILPTYPPCPAQDIFFTNGCEDDPELVVFWDGETCLQGWGCASGVDVVNGYADYDSCMTDHELCRPTSCASQDIVGEGLCTIELGARWDGRSCEAIRGCSLAGDDVMGRFVDVAECGEIQGRWCECTPTTCGAGLRCVENQCVVEECGSEIGSVPPTNARMPCGTGQAAVVRGGHWLCVDRRSCNPPTLET